MQRSTGSADLLYRLTAPHYEADIAPVLRLFAENLAGNIPLAPTNTLLDVGTGTGLLLRETAGQAACSIGVDLSMPMLRVARSLLNSGDFPRTHLLQMDANTLTGLAEKCIDVAAASFGLNDGDPASVFRALARVLKPGGALVFQEWGPYDRDDPRLVVDEILAAYDEAIPAEYDDFLAALALPRRWEQQLQDTEDYTECLTLAGFEVLRVQECRPVLVNIPIESFLAYALAWPPRSLVLQALAEDVRYTVVRQSINRLQGRWSDAAGLLSWNPVLFLCSSVRKI